MRVLAFIAAVICGCGSIETESVDPRRMPERAPEPGVVVELAPIEIVGARPVPESVPADAAAGRGWRPTPAGAAVSLARIYFNEADGRSRADERLIYQVLSRLSGGGRPDLRQMRAYSSRATGVEPPGRSERVRWVAELDAAGTEPPSYQATIPWRAVRGRWLRTLERARRDLAEPPENPCAGARPHHWGSRRLRSDLRHACAAGWVPLECAGSLNVGWCVPGLASCPERAAADPCNDRPGA